MASILYRLASRLAPFLLRWGQRLKKQLRRARLQREERSGRGITQEKLAEDFARIGLRPGDSVLVHLSFSRIGYVEGGAATLIGALEEVITEKGTLLFPTFPANGSSKEYLDKTPVFDIRHTPSAMGAATEYFRKMPGVTRSFHPTDPVCARGPLADYYTQGHFGQLTPYNQYSPFFRLAEQKGKILIIGIGLDISCTNLHTLEDAVDFKYPVYLDKLYEVQMIDEAGTMRHMKTRAHNPAWSARRRNNELIPLFEKEGILKHGMIGQANSMLIDAWGLHETMVRLYHERGVTMYTPKGENNL